MIRGVFMLLLLLVGELCAQSQIQNVGAMKGGTVVLDIGHFMGGEGASAPGAVNGTILRECEFWYRYAGVVKEVIERAGWNCVVTNRGFAPTHEPLAGIARKTGVVQLRRPDAGGKRTPSRYHPDRVGSGMVSADYAIWKKAACIVFLHLNSSGSRWTSAGRSVILCNHFNGRGLASSICRALDSEVLNHGMPNGGRGCSIEVRRVDADRAAGWLNACDDSGIPAAVVEAAFVNNRAHVEYLTRDAGARVFAQAIGHGIVNFLRSGASPRHVRKNENAPDVGSFGYAAESRRLSVPGARRLLP